LQGEHAHRIWNAIYAQNCFRHVHSTVCDEESLVFYRIISGVHTSISMHLLRQYPLDEQLTTWGLNMDIFKERMVPAERCGHVSNLYFAYLFVLQAVARAAPALREVHYFTGMAAEDLATQVRPRTTLKLRTWRLLPFLQYSDLLSACVTSTVQGKQCSCCWCNRLDAAGTATPMSLVKEILGVAAGDHGKHLVEPSAAELLCWTL
jgi:Endoplasmic Reticulum Oxidoreductin 1 (ERO1)